MIAFPNAKINLGLNIIEKRNDGFHNIETILYPIPFHDILEIIPSKKFELFEYGRSIHSNLESNLCFKAFRLLQDLYQIPNVSIHLYKKIPPGSGLGGGSSNGAFTLKLLNTLFKLNLNQKKLESLALELGSDTPFFIQNKTIFASGRGEVFEPIDLYLNGYWICLALPEIHIDTKSAFNEIHPKFNSENITEIISKPIHFWPNRLRNQFEDIQKNKHLSIQTILELLKAKSIYSAMSGTGSSMYGIFEKPVTLDLPCKHLWLELN